MGAKVQKNQPDCSDWLSQSRDDKIRTCGLFVPNEARYRAALHPEPFCAAKVHIFLIWCAKCFPVFFNPHHFALFEGVDILTTQPMSCRLTKEGEHLWAAPFGNRRFDVVNDMPSKTDDTQMLQKDFQSDENQYDTSNNARRFLIFRAEDITYLHAQNGE